VAPGGRGSVSIQSHSKDRHESKRLLLMAFLMLVVIFFSP
jgi:hypothetical protein